MSLAFEVIGSGTQTMLICHGILGSRRNWRGFARQLTGALPGWQAVLVDLRAHGDSTALGPPFTVAQCAADLTDLVRAEGLAPAVVIGHSFGGKVALSYTDTLPPDLRQTWVLDATPAPISREDAAVSEVSQVIAALRTIPPLKRRTDLLSLLTGQGFSLTLARWMTTNLRHTPDGLQWRFDIDGIEALISDYFDLDLWHVLEMPTANLTIHVVRAEHSGRWTDDVVDRLESISLDTTLHTLPDAGHWVHVDNPDGLVAMMTAHWME